MKKRSDTQDRPKMVSNSGDKLDGQLLSYIWETYVMWVA